MSQLVSHLQDYLCTHQSLLPLLVFILLDLCGLPSLWGESIFRRTIHHVSGGGYAKWRLLNSPPFLIWMKGGTNTTNSVERELCSRSKSIHDDCAAASDEDNGIYKDQYQQQKIKHPKTSMKMPMTHNNASSPPQQKEQHSSPKMVPSLLTQKHISMILKMITENEAKDNPNNHKYYGEGNGLNTKSMILSKLISGQHSKRSTIYYKDFTPAGQQILNQIGNEMIQPLSQIMGMTCDGSNLHLGSSDFRVVLLRYEGAQASFPFHYDQESWNCFRMLALIKRSQEGTVTPFSYIDQHGIVQDVALEQLGDGVLFQGTRIYHGTRMSSRDDSIRWMIGFQFRVGEDLEMHRKSLCNQIRGGAYSMWSVYLLYTSRLFPLLLIKMILTGEISVSWLQEWVEQTRVEFNMTSSTFAHLHTLLHLSRCTQLMISILLIVLFTFHDPTRQLPFIIQNWCSHFNATFENTFLVDRNNVTKKSVSDASLTSSNSKCNQQCDDNESGAIHGNTDDGGNQKQKEEIGIVPNSGIPLPTTLPMFQTENTPKSLYAWLLIMIVMMHSCNDIILSISFAAYLVVSECCILSHKIDKQYMDKCKSLDILRQHLPHGFAPCYRRRISKATKAKAWDWRGCRA